MSGSAAQTAPVNAVGVGMSYAHWEARRNQQHQDKNTYAANINKFYDEMQRLQKERGVNRTQSQSNSRSGRGPGVKWFYKEAPKVLSDKWTSQSSYRRFPHSREEYVYTAKLPSRFSNTHYFQQW
ncbi:uncharacterized protein LOC134839623 isoform X2 [Symsagittifera roscoffensis]|uniref:uncharacterized protein LOC134839623 isoform X2 n=1 Tax=Symsagittifera roscoffensis TaxID=84072 RepID=UPI00307BEEB6